MIADSGLKYDDIGYYASMVDRREDEARQTRAFGAHMGLYARWGLARGEDGPMIDDAPTRAAAAELRAGRRTGTEFLAEFMDWKLYGALFDPRIRAFSDVYYGGVASQYMHDTRAMRRRENLMREETDYDFDRYAEMVDARLADFGAQGGEAVRRRGVLARLFGARGPREIHWEAD